MSILIKDPNYLRPLTSYCKRYYAIQTWVEFLTAWRDEERLDKDLCEVAAMKYMQEHYPNNSGQFRLVQKIISEITYEVE